MSEIDNLKAAVLAELERAFGPLVRWLNRRPSWPWWVVLVAQVLGLVVIVAMLVEGLT